MRAGWRVDFDDYERLLSLPGAGWAWEFKRRDPALIRAHRCVRAVRAGAAKRTDGSIIYRLNQRCHVAEKFGLHFIPDPALSAFDTATFWLPEAMSAGFDAVIDAQETGMRRATRLRWDELPGEKFFLMAPGRRDKLVIRAPFYAMQFALDADGAPVPQSAFFSLKIGADHLAPERLRHLEEFARLCRGFAARATSPRGAAPAKLRDALIALDGALDGASRRQIADAIFGAEVVQPDWDSGIYSYKQRVKRLVDKGLALMRDGYRKLI